MCARILLFLLSIPCFSFAGNHDISGYIGLETRLFFNEAAFPNQRIGTGPSLVFEPEYYYLSDERTHQVTLKSYLHLDPYDVRRRRFDLREFNYLFDNGDFALRTGIGKVFWGVLESNHLVDTINQIDGVIDVDGEDRLGQPMIELSALTDFGQFRAYYLPYFRERSFPGKHGRLRGPIVVSHDDSLYENDKGQWHPDFAFRYSHIIGNFDLGLSHFSGTAREPNFRLIAGELVPFYQIIHQPSLDLQYTEGAWLLKLEALYRKGHGRDFAAFGTGFEYSFYDIRGSGIDLGLVSEFHFDDRDSGAPATIFDKDVFAGTRLSFNDASDSALLAGGVFDLEDGTNFFSIEASRRLFDQYKIEFDVRLFNNVGSKNTGLVVSQDDFVQLRLVRYF